MCIDNVNNDDRRTLLSLHLPAPLPIRVPTRVLAMMFVSILLTTLASHAAQADTATRMLDTDSASGSHSGSAHNDCRVDQMCYRLPLASFEHIEFGRIPANTVNVDADTITLDVMKSASFLMHSFDDVLNVKQVSMSWKSDGKPAVPNAIKEQQKGGDDAVVKLGLLLRADKKPFKPFLPAWMEKVEASLKYPSTEMIYAVADSKHNSGERWVSPYNDRVTMVSMQDGMSDDGWYHSKLVFEQPVEVVAVWLMSDGDDTQSSFTTQVRVIQLRAIQLRAIDLP